MDPEKIYGSDPKPLTEFPVKVSLEDLKIIQTVWGEDAMGDMVTDICLRLGSKIIEAVRKLDFDTSEYIDDNNIEGD